MGCAGCALRYNSSVKRAFVHLTFNQVVAGSIPARPTKYQALTSALEKGVSQMATIVQNS